MAEDQIQIGGIWHNVTQVEYILQKFCKQIFANTDNPEWPYCLRGSGSAVRFDNRYFVFCCRHQIHDFPHDKIAIPLSFEPKIMTAGSMKVVSVTDLNHDDEATDIAVFEYDVASYGIPNLMSEFLSIDDQRIWPQGTAQLPFMVFGYPSYLRYYDENSIKVTNIKVQAQYAGGTSSIHLHRVKMEQALDDPDGMSGGPVFYIGGAPGTYFVGFAGMVMRGGRKSPYLHFITADHLIRMALAREND